MRIAFLIIVVASINASLSFAEEIIKPITIGQLQRFSLVEQMPKTKAYDIRMRKIVVASGAKIAEHNHKDRAGMVYVISGEIVEYRNGEITTLKSGDSLVEDFNTVHAYENKSNQDCVMIAFDILKTESNKHLEKFIEK